MGHEERETVSRFLERVFDFFNEIFSVRSNGSRRERETVSKKTQNFCGRDIRRVLTMRQERDWVAKGIKGIIKTA